jgi:hypothetical protein
MQASFFISGGGINSGLLEFTPAPHLPILAQP